PPRHGARMSAPSGCLRLRRPPKRTIPGCGRPPPSPLAPRGTPPPLAGPAAASGTSPALVATAETVAKAMLEYYKLVATSLLIRGYDPRPDAVQYGEELIPRVRALVAEHAGARRAPQSP